MTELERSQQREIAQLREQLAERDARITLLEQKVDLLIRQIYSPKSERLDPDQLELLFGPDGLGKAEASAGDVPEAEADDQEVEQAKQASKPRRPRIPEHLPVVEKVIDPDCVKACPEAWRCIGEEISEQLDYQPGRFLRRRLVRRKFVKRAAPNKAPIIAPLPEKLLERGIAAPGLLAQITISKFCDHLPFYRQEQIFEDRHNVILPRQTMARWMGTVADWLKPIYRQIAREMLSSNYLQADETPIKYLQPGTGRAQQGYLWTYHVPGANTLFDWQPSRAHGCLARMIPDGFQGTIQCDGYSAYQTFAAKHGGIALAGCWAHVRRKFIEAQAMAPCDTGVVLLLIGKLYRIEAQLRQSRASPGKRQEIRQRDSVPILTQLHALLSQLTKSQAYLPQSQMGKAIRYNLELWNALQTYISDGRVEIDNNLIENAIRPTALGKKNWLFIGRKDTGWRSAVIYTVLACCRNHGIEPYQYLKIVLETLPRTTDWKVKHLTPAAWAGCDHLEVLRSVA